MSHDLLRSWNILCAITQDPERIPDGTIFVSHRGLVLEEERARVPASLPRGDTEAILLNILSGVEKEDTPAPEHLTLSGRLVAGRYQILSRLGQGGIGRVYHAQQVGLDRPAAVKVIRPERKDDPITVKRFLREARAAGRINSPHVVTLYDCGRDNEELYIAMELLQGESLSEKLKREFMTSAADAIKIGIGVARGLQAAHEAGVLHRDLKPGNVFICDDGMVKVLDFGIAKLLDDEETDEPLTAASRILGTPLYMSPEAITRKELGPTADLYSLGVLIFHMVSGSPPFPERDPFAALRAHLSVPPPLLRDVATVPAALDELINELLAKDPRKRPKDAGEVAAALSEIGRTLGADAGDAHGRTSAPGEGEPPSLDLSTQPDDAPRTWGEGTNSGDATVPDGTPKLTSQKSAAAVRRLSGPSQDAQVPQDNDQTASQTPPERELNAIPTEASAETRARVAGLKTKKVRAIQVSKGLLSAYSVAQVAVIAFALGALLFGGVLLVRLLWQS